MRDPEKYRLCVWSAVTGSLSVAVSGVATMWLPSPWDTAAWAVVAIVLCTVCGLSYPVLPSAPVFWPPAGLNRSPQSWGRRYEHDQFHPGAGDGFHRLGRPVLPDVNAAMLSQYWPQDPNDEAEAPQ